MSTPKLINEMADAAKELQTAINKELTHVVLANNWEDMVTNTPQDISARYWLMTFLEPLNRKELKSMVDGFLVNMLNDEQAKKLVKFLMIRYPQYYKQDVEQSQDTIEESGSVLSLKSNKR